MARAVIYNLCIVLLVDFILAFLSDFHIRKDTTVVSTQSGMMQIYFGFVKGVFTNVTLFVHAICSSPELFSQRSKSAEE